MPYRVPLGGALIERRLILQLDVSQQLSGGKIDLSSDEINGDQNNSEKNQAQISCEDCLFAHWPAPSRISQLRQDLMFYAS